MSCPNCGNPVKSQDKFCGGCGRKLEGNQEDVVYSFGPWGTGVCFRRPGFLTVIQRNDTRIMLTDSRIYGESNFSGSLRFDVRYDAVVTTETFSYMLWKVLWIQYRRDDKVKEVSVMCTAGNGKHIDWSYDFLEKRRLQH